MSDMAEATAVLRDIEVAGMRHPSVFTCEDGTVSVEWVCPRLIVSVDINHELEFSCFCLNPLTRDVQELDTKDIDAASEFLKRTFG